MSGYYAIVHKDEDSAYGVFFPGLPGCYAAGDTQDEALENARISLRIYVEDLVEEGKPLPKERALEDLTSDVDVKEALADGNGYVVAIPLLFADKKRRVNVTLEPSLIAAIDHAAEIAGTSRSDYMATAARRELENSVGAVSVNVPQPEAKPTPSRQKQVA